MLVAIKKIKLNNRIIILFFLILKASICFSNSELDSLLKTKQFKETILPSSNIINDSIPKELNKFFFRLDRWNLILDNFVVYQLRVEKDGEYIVKCLSENEQLYPIVFDDSLNKITEGKYVENRAHVSEIKVPLKKDSNYFLFLTGSVDHYALNYKLAFHSSNEIISIGEIEPKLILQEGIEINKSIFDKESQLIQGKNRDVYSLERLSRQNKWIRLKVETEYFQPYICLMDENGFFIECTDRYNYSTEAEIILSPDDKSKLALIAVDFSQVEKEKIKNFNYSLIAKSYNYNPEDGLIGRIIYLFKNPFIPFILGVLFAIGLRWFFYRKSLVTKILAYEEVTDKILINEEENTGLEFQIGDNIITKASLFEFEFSHIGRNRIQSDYIIEPIILNLKNINEIVDLRSEKKGQGWKNPSIIEGKDKIKIDFDFIDSSDYLKLRIICKEDEETINKGITPLVAGKISETIIKAKNKNWSKANTLFLSISGIVNVFILIPFILFTVILGFDINLSSVPKWVFEIIEYLWYGWVIYFAIFIFLTKGGRRIIKYSFKSIKYTIKSIFSSFKT